MKISVINNEHGKVVASNYSYRQLGNRLFVRSPQKVVADARVSRAMGATASVGEDAVGEDNVDVGGVNPAPVFVGQGSKIENPDLQVVFWGPYWPGNGALSRDSLMAAFTSIVSGPYLSGLSQYGYAGPVRVRPPIVTSSAPLPALPLQNLAPGVQQSQGIYDAVRSMVEGMVNDNQISGVDDNHDLIVMVVLDPVIPYPQDEDGAGKVSTVWGSHGKVEIFEFLDDNTRFALGWTGSGPGGLGQPDQTTKTFSHELVEAITDPFPSSGWVQTPGPASGVGEIADVCKKDARVDGVTVASYWSVADQTCIVPTEHRFAYLTQKPGLNEPHDSRTRQVFHDFGKLCNSGVYDYVERTYHNQLTVQANLTGYQSPAFSWTIAGAPVPAGVSTQAVPATWVEPVPNPPGGGSKKVGAPGGRIVRPTTANLQVNNTGASLIIDVGPGEGNTAFDVGLTVQESWDNPPSGGGQVGQITTRNVASTFVSLQNEEIHWGEAYLRDQVSCRHNHGLANNPVPHFGPPQPGDPGPRVSPGVLRALVTRGPQRAERLIEAAAELQVENPELAAALAFMAEHPRTG